MVKNGQTGNAHPAPNSNRPRSRILRTRKEEKNNNNNGQNGQKTVKIRRRNNYNNNVKNGQNCQTGNAHPAPNSNRPLFASSE